MAAKKGKKGGKKAAKKGKSAARKPAKKAKKAAKKTKRTPNAAFMRPMTIDAAHKYGKRADICGELGSDAAAIPILLGLGMDELG
jgi:phosphoenolpyruvate-protein kinase (PTS system EI component)